MLLVFGCREYSYNGNFYQVVIGGEDVWIYLGRRRSIAVNTVRDLPISANGLGP